MTSNDDLLPLLRDLASEETPTSEARIGEESFARFLAADWSGLPPVSVFRARDGFAVAYRHYPADSDKALILVHGSAGFGGHQHVLARAIAGRGLAQVYAPDMRGHGLSGSGGGNAATDSEQMCNDVSDLIALIRDRQNPKRIVLGGHSAGGGLILRAAVGDQAGHVSAYLLLAPFLGGRAPTTRPGLGGWIRPYPKRIRAITELNKRGMPWFNGLPVLEFNQPMATRDGRETLSWSYATMLAFDPCAWKTNVKSIGEDRPTIVVVGDRDECFIPEAYAETICEVAPHARVDIVQGLGHWDLLVAQESVAVVTEWLASL